MSWISLTETHIKARLAKDELENYLQAGSQVEEGIDSLAGIIDQVTAMVRGKVAAWSDNLSKMGASGTIPSECLFAASTIARDALVGSLPLSEGITKARQEELRQAHSFLNSISKGEVRIEDTNGTLPETQSTAEASYGGFAILEF